jgi:hypothetical protein
MARIKGEESQEWAVLRGSGVVDRIPVGRARQTASSQACDKCRRREPVTSHD